jgi:hypothetical protein
VSNSKHLSEAVFAVIDKYVQPEDPTRVIHLPHELYPWGESTRREMLNALLKNAHDGNARKQITQEYLMCAFLIGYTFAQQGHTVTECTCGELQMTTVADLLAAWEEEDAGAPGEPTQEQTE